MNESNLDKEYREKLLKGELTLQTKEEYLEYKKIPPHQKIIGMEKMAFMMNKLEAAKNKNGAS